MTPVVIHCSEAASPLGLLRWAEVASDTSGAGRAGRALTWLEFADPDAPLEAFAGQMRARHRGDTELDATGSPVRAQLDEYFAGRRRAFDLALAPRGTPFQQRVWQLLCTISYGATWSYGALARALGDPNAVRAVARANGQNPIAIVIPCHRVIGSDGSLTGYAGGLPKKRALLDLEARQAGAQGVLPW